MPDRVGQTEARASDLELTQARIRVKQLASELLGMVDWAEHADDLLKTRIALNTKAGQLEMAVKHYGRLL